MLTDRTDCKPSYGSQLHQLNKFFWFYWIWPERLPADWLTPQVLLRAQCIHSHPSQICHRSYKPAFFHWWYPQRGYTEQFCFVCCWLLQKRMEATATAHVLPISYTEVCIVLDCMLLQSFLCIQFCTKLCLFERLKDYFSSNCIEENASDYIILHVTRSFTSERALRP